MKKVRIYPHPGMIPAPDTPTAFYAREIPALLTTPKDDLVKIYEVKETMPGSLIEYMT
jgi:hypothetical protein